MDDLNNLIDLLSPEIKFNEANKNQPLIPCPSAAQHLLINNPFDNICEQLHVTTGDPFEAVLSKAMCYKKTDNKKKTKKYSTKSSAKSATSESEESVSNFGATVEKDGEVNVFSTNLNISNSNITEMPSFALTNKEEDENKENCDLCSPKLGNFNDVSYFQGNERAPLSKISTGKLHLQDESCPSLLDDVDEMQTRLVDFLTDPLRTDVKSGMTVSEDDNGMKGKCHSVSMLFLESDKRLKTTANSTFCGDFDGLEGFKPLGYLVNSSFSQSFVKNNEKDLLCLTCDQINSKANFRTSSAPSLSTKTGENGVVASREAIFSPELSPVLNNRVRGSSSSSMYSFMNRAMILSKTEFPDDASFSFSSRKVKGNTIDNLEENDNDDVFVEAKILAQSFSEPGHVDDRIDEEADLLSIELNLVHANSSDEENDSLRNDPSLNFNFSSPATRQRNFIEFSDAVKKYRKRRSADPIFSSTDALNKSQENCCEKKSASFSNSETPKSSKNRNCSSPTSITAGLNLLKKQIDSLPIGNNIRQSQKPKQDESGDCNQKGAPLKATVPIQFMIRSGVNKDIGVEKKTVAVQPIIQSKVRAAARMRGQKNANTPRPVASSTPNKNKSLNESPGQSLIMEDNYNNCSFNSSDGYEPQKSTRYSSLSSIPCSDQSLKSSNGKLNCTPTRNGLSVRNSMPTMKQNNKKLSPLSRNSANLGVRNNILSPSSSLSGRKYGKLPTKIVWGQIRTHRDKENVMPIQQIFYQ